MAEEVQGQAAEASESSESSEATIAVHWREEGYYLPPPKFIGQANASDPAIRDRFSEENFPECFKEYGDLCFGCFGLPLDVFGHCVSPSACADIQIYRRKHSKFNAGRHHPLWSRTSYLASEVVITVSTRQAYHSAEGTSSGKARSSPVIRMIFSSDGRAAVSLSWRPACRACRAVRARTPRPEASQKVSPDRSTLTGAGQASITSLR